MPDHIWHNIIQNRNKVRGIYFAKYYGGVAAREKNNTEGVGEKWIRREKGKGKKRL